MNKINGYTQEEAENLIEYIYEGKGKGKTLSFLFDAYGRSHGRAKGSVRNYYYALLKSRGDARVDRLLKGKNLYAEEIKEFTEEETDDMIRRILGEKNKGYSVRHAIRNIAGDDEKLTLRLQNKYRNVLKKQPERIERIRTEMGVLPDENERADRRLLLQKRIENEINSMYDKLNVTLKQENERLLKENDSLKRQIESLMKE